MLVTAVCRFCKKVQKSAHTDSNSDKLSLFAYMPPRRTHPLLPSHTLVLMAWYLVACPSGAADALRVQKTFANQFLYLSGRFLFTVAFVAGQSKPLPLSGTYTICWYSIFTIGLSFA